MLPMINHGKSPEYFSFSLASWFAFFNDVKKGEIFVNYINMKILNFTCSIKKEEGQHELRKSRAELK